MNVMMNSRAKTGGQRLAESGSLKRLELEMALELGAAGGRSFNEAVQQAADGVGGDLLFVLPAADGGGHAALLCLLEDGASLLLQVRNAGSGFAVSEEQDIDAAILGFARASIDVLERLRDDRLVLAPLTSSTH